MSYKMAIHCYKTVLFESICPSTTEWVGSGVTSFSVSGLTVLLGGVGLGICVAVLIVMLIAARRRHNSPQHMHETSGKQLELTHGDQHRYVVAYQLKPETKQPDILSRSEYDSNLDAIFLWGLH